MFNQVHFTTCQVLNRKKSKLQK